MGNVKRLYSLSVCALLLGMICTVNAQVAVSVSMNHGNLMAYEPVFAKVSLRNFSGHPLVFGKSEMMTGSINFEIKGPRGELIMPIDRNVMPTISGLLIESGKREEIIIQLSRYYPLFNTGRYSLRAYISHPQLKKSYQSDRISFSISSGIMIWEHMVGVPDIEGKRDKKEQIPQRNYKISSLYDNNRNYYYLTVEDDTHIYSVRRIGVEMSMSRPQCEIDRLSRLHVLLATTPRIYSYFIFDHDGKLEHEAVYRKSDTTPLLVRNLVSGSVSLSGGELAKKGVDYGVEEDNSFGQIPGSTPSSEAQKQLQDAGGTL
ncbi:MAG: hypothetical protein JXR78_18340 [Victivallales bacterium]|nr:hypothetical protein [Victivallales bacterium]